MNPQERKIIDDLFDKLAQAERQTGPPEPTAEAHIHARMHAQPGAPYLMAQTIVMPMLALEAAQSRIASLARPGHAAQASRTSGRGLRAQRISARSASLAARSSSRSPGSMTAPYS